MLALCLSFSWHMSLLSSLNCMRDGFRSASQSLRFKNSSSIPLHEGLCDIRSFIPVCQDLKKRSSRSFQVSIHRSILSFTFILLLIFLCVRKGLIWGLGRPQTQYIADGFELLTPGVQPEPGACQANVLPTELHLQPFVSTSSFPDQPSISLSQQIKKLLFQASHVPVIYKYSVYFIPVNTARL